MLPRVAQPPQRPMVHAMGRSTFSSSVNTRIDAGRSRPRTSPMTSIGSSTPRTETSINGLSRRVPAGALRDRARQHHLEAFFLGQRLEPARHVDGVADHREVDRLAVADTAEQERADLDADADLQRPAQLRLELGVDVVEHEIDRACRAQGLAATDLDPRMLPEYGEQPVAEELVDPAAVLGDRSADDGEELVQHVHDVVGQPFLRQAREIAQVDEHHDERFLDAGRIGFLQLRRFRPRR